VMITEAHELPAAAATKDAPAVPASCRVQGISRPTLDSDIHFEIDIPVGSAWNGRYLQLGNGGFAGSLPDDMLDVLAAGYAVAGTDDGHQSQSGFDASWALGHPEKVIDFGYRALKETTDAARAILRAYEGRAPAHSYFQGCSDGGREALMEAQRYPDDFDGIVVGAPANHWTRLAAMLAAEYQALNAIPASYVPAAKLRALEDAALSACGAVDGVIEDPLSCRFDPAVLRCKGADEGTCLTDAQLKAVRSIYAGTKNPRTHEVIEPGPEPGVEAERRGWSILVGHGPGTTKGTAFEYARNFYAFVVFADPAYDVMHLNLDTDVAMAEAKIAPILNAEAVDLGAFQKHGGKLIHYHGWGDPLIPPRDSVQYYEAVHAKMGDTSGFYRLFMAPGMLHCGGGAGPNVITTLPAITDWVENGKAPDRLLAAKLAGEGPDTAVDHTRPLCPYPMLAVWDGKGDRKRAESYACQQPVRSGK
jgi:feruloyl esterase